MGLSSMYAATVSHTTSRRRRTQLMAASGVGGCVDRRAYSNAGIPVIQRPRMRLWMSWVPS